MWLRASIFALLAIWVGIGCSSNEDRFIIRTTGEYSAALREATELSREPLTRFGTQGSIDSEDQRKLIQAQIRYEALTEFQPTLFTLHFALGAVRHALGNTAEAEQAFRQALTLIPTNPTPDAAKVIADTHHGLARVLIDHGNFSEARSEAKIAVEYSADDATYLSTLAAAEIQMKDLVNAKLHLEKALSLEPNHGRARVLQKLLQERGRG